MWTLQVFMVFNFLNFSREYMYYISNYENQAVNGACNFEDEKLSPCGYFEDVEKEIYLNLLQEKTINFVLLPYNYSIYQNVSLYFFSHSEVNFFTIESRTQAKIFCGYGDLSLHYTNTSIVSIDSIEFHHCGKYGPVIAIEDVYEEVHIISVIFKRSSYHFINTSGAVSKLNIVDCVFDGSIHNYGVYIGSHGLNTVIANSTFRNCSMGSLIISSPRLVSKNASIRIINCTFLNNRAKNSAEGSAITFYSEVNFYVNNCCFIKNTEGSALVVRSGYYSLLQISSSTFFHNEAKEGGAIYVFMVSTLLIRNSHFEKNCASKRGGAIKVEDIVPFMLINFTLRNCTFLGNYADVEGGGIFGQSFYNAKIILTIHFSDFTSNRARDNGGALAASANADNYHASGHTPRYFLTKYNIIILNSSFRYNSVKHCGGALFLNQVNDVTVRHSHFSHNFANYSGNMDGGGAVYLVQRSPSIFTADRSSFSSNNAGTGGGLSCKSVSQKDYIQITGSTFFNNKATSHGGAMFLRNTILELNATTLSDNKAPHGGGVCMRDAYLIIDSANFMGNMACIGGAIYSIVAEISLQNINLVNNVAFKFTRNNTRTTSPKGASHFHVNCSGAHDGKGGAIFIYDTGSSCDLRLCPLTWNSDSIIQYANNSAESGSVLYGGMISRCYQVSSKQYMALWDTSIDYAITSEAIHFCFVRDAINPDCSSRFLNKTIYLGQAFQIDVVCLDQVMQTKKCNITSEYTQPTKISFNAGEQKYDIDKFETLTFHAFSQTESNAILVMISDTFCAMESTNTLKVYLEIQDCPLGFEKIINTCKCDRRLIDYFKTVKCNIDNVSIYLSDKGWFGFDEHSLRVHHDCPLNYCSQIHNTTFVSYAHTPCAYNREGILCGKCLANYSVVIGSWKCEDCTGVYKRNSFIWLTVLLAMAGVLLVVFLLLVKMTVSSGTTNGLILYANILSVSGLLDLSGCSIHPVLRVFLSWINLDLGIEVCYYSGMDVYQKTWLQFAFPFYVWFLVGVIIVFCHYSSRVMKLMGMRNIEVLATLFLLSYAKLLKTIVTALSYTDVKVASASNVSDNFTLNRVWLYDAHIDYLSPKHLPLFIVSLIILVCLCVPYTFMLLFGQCMTSIPKRRGLHWIHSPVLSTILDAYYAPYRKHTRFWTGLGLLLRCGLFTLYGTSYSINNNLFWITVSVGLLFIFRMCCGGLVYQKKAIDLVEVIFLANLGAMALLLHHREEWCEALTTSASLSLAIFFGLLIIHAFWAVKMYNLCRNCSQKHFSFNPIANIILKESSRVDIQDEDDTTEKRENHSVTYVELRETLIDH